MKSSPLNRKPSIGHLSLVLALSLLAAPSVLTAADADDTHSVAHAVPATKTGAPSALFVDATGNVGVGTETPGQKLEIFGGNVKVGKNTGGNTSFFIENTGGAVTSSWILRANSANGAFTFTEAGANSPFRILPGAAQGTFDINSTGVAVVGSLRVNGVTMTVPDYVFEPSYDLLPIEKQGEYMHSRKHLPAVGAAQYDNEGRATVDIGAHQMGMLEELEKAHLYIQQLNGKIEQKDQQITALEARLARLETLLQPNP
ncbi:MAG: hypothetical protein HC897_04925 [Thermoanaerobaculia bacterium]|nr:hypothetical protein [Thermoanaerobaculia bacterium]